MGVTSFITLEAILRLSFAESSDFAEKPKNVSTSPRAGLQILTVEAERVKGTHM